MNAGNEFMEPASVEVWREGPGVWVAVRSESRKGLAIELSRDEARELAAQLEKCAAGTVRRVLIDWPQA